MPRSLTNVTTILSDSCFHWLWTVAGYFE